MYMPFSEFRFKYLIFGARFADNKQIPIQGLQLIYQCAAKLSRDLLYISFCITKKEVLFTVENFRIISQRLLMNQN